MTSPFQLPGPLRSRPALRGFDLPRSDLEEPPADAGRADSDDGARIGLEVEPEVELFANALDECLAATGTYSERRARLLKLVGVYHEAALSRVESARRIARNNARSETDNITQDGNDMDWEETEDSRGLDISPRELEKYENEARIWSLLGRLLPLRYPDINETRRDHRPDPRQQSRHSLWQEFLESDPVARERAAVLAWLQYNATFRPDIDELVKDLQQSAERGDIVTHGWLHTKAAIKLRKSIQAWHRHIEPNTPVSQALLNSEKAPLATQLDPDSMTRQNRRLQPEDQFFEQAIWLGCYELLRRGKGLGEIMEWCSDRTEVWRAVSMSPWPISESSKVGLGTENCDTLALWRRMCFALLRQGGTDDFERAVYGVLCGDVASVEKICRSWDDFVFAHYNAALQAKFDTFVLKHCAPEISATLRRTFPTIEFTQFPDGRGTLEKSLVQTLEADDRTREEALSPMVALQASIIANDIDRHLFDQGIVLAQQANAKHESKLIPPPDMRGLEVDARKYIDLADHSGLRTMSHILIIISALEDLQTGSGREVTTVGRQVQRQAQENVLAAYITYLRLAGFEELIPLYCSKLESSRIYNVLSRSLMHLTDPERRVLELQLIRKAGLDALNFVTLQSRRIFDDLGDEQKATLAVSLFKIMDNAPPTMKYGRPIKTDFFGDDPDRIEHGDEQLIRSLEWLLLVEEAWPEVFAVGLRVYKYFLRRLRLNAARALSFRVSFSTVIRQKLGQAIPGEFDASWFDEATIWGSEPNGQQVALDARNFWELESLVRLLDSMETMASLAQLTKEGQSIQRDFWPQVGEEVKMAKVFVQPLLKQWLLSSSHEDEVLHLLRDIYLPEAILAYISTLHYAGAWMSRDNLLECMELAATIAEKGSDLAACFVKANRMRELVEAFAACSKALAMAAGEKKGTSSTSKKLREMGWSRDLWSVQRDG